MFWTKKKTQPVMFHCWLACPKSKQCQLWVELNNRVVLEDGSVKNVPEGRCSIAWIPTLLIEIKGSLQNERTNEKVSGEAGK